MPEDHSQLIHPVNFNDLASVEYVCKKHPIAALITEPILQNIGIVHPQPGYLQGLRDLAGRYGFLLIFDEVKTGFRHALGGSSTIAGVEPDLVVSGKALANGYPMAALAGKNELLQYFVHPDARLVGACHWPGRITLTPFPPRLRLPLSKGCWTARFTVISTA